MPAMSQGGGQAGGRLSLGHAGGGQWGAGRWKTTKGPRPAGSSSVLSHERPWVPARRQSHLFVLTYNCRPQLTIHNEYCIAQIPSLLRSFLLLKKLDTSKKNIYTE